ncbi:hypothetical protein SAMN04515667_1936 [Formosa sp. Hel1_31_208]|uniref:hypothetical protein n=1 Tax=Formosa sp. Hel1_31_208 TaxID=1798225 RepID=UPI00087B66D2|nr:hypothetical protein [Formosa sp. Hel1_31_208]SDS33239.1 hypothetical protein SAMN04515667_1936 [Formosa sp. Hel1_31_208]
MSSSTKLILSAAIRNGLLWSAILIVLTYLKNGIIYTNYLPLWFLFFAGTGALRKYYFLTKENKN